jgi:hypothetical protein
MQLSDKNNAAVNLFFAEAIDSTSAIAKDNGAATKRSLEPGTIAT